MPNTAPTKNTKINKVEPAMNAVTPFEAKLVLPAAVEAIALSELALSPLNPRQWSDPAGDALLAQSIIACGLIQNLVGLRDEATGKIGIVAGGRRLRALQLAVETRPDLSPVMVMLAPDEASALRMASAENSAREAMDAADEIRNFGRMRETGASASEIASVFGVTEAHVYKRLRLASLPAAVLDALKAREISLSIAEAFTLAASEQNVLELLPVVVDRSYSASQVRSALTNATISGNDHRALFIGQKAYAKAGGVITRDLFEETVYFDDVDLLDALFVAKLDKKAEDERKKGWAWVQTVTTPYTDTYNEPVQLLQLSPSPLSEEDQARLTELSENDDHSNEARKERAALNAKAKRTEATDAEKAVSGVFLHVDRYGKLTVAGPYVRADEAQAALEAGIITSLGRRVEEALKPAEAAEEKPRSVFSQAVKDDIKAVELHAFQSSLRNNQKMALALLAFSLSDGSGSAEIFGLRPTMPKNLPSSASGMVADEALVSTVERNTGLHNSEQAFAEFCQKSDSEIMEILTAGAVRTIHNNFGYVYATDLPALFESMTKALNVDPRGHWTPTKEGFWGRVSGDYMETVFAALTGIGADAEVMKAFAKAKKSEKAATMERLFNDPAYQSTLQLTDDQIEAISRWMPTEA